MIKNLSIKTPLTEGFFALLSFFGILGGMTSNQNERHEYQPKNLFKSLIRMKRLIGLLRSQIHSIQQNQNNLFPAEIKRELLIALKRIEGNNSDARKQPEVILSGYLEPTTGIEAFKAIRNDSHPEHVPVIALTASAMTSDREIILAHGFDAYIPKPIDSKVFFETMDTTLYGK